MPLAAAKLAEIREDAEVLGARTIRLLLDDIEERQREVVALAAEVARLTYGERP